MYAPPQMGPPQGPPMMPNGMPVPVGGVPGAPIPMPGSVPLPNGVPIPIQHIEILTPAVLASAPPEQQKQLIGERIFPLVQRQQVI